VKVLLLINILSAYSTFVADGINDVPPHYADFLGGRFTLLGETASFQIHIERLYQNYSGPVYIFIDSDGDTSTGWTNTGYISEDEFPLLGADLLLIINQLNPERSTLYALSSSGSYTFSSYVTCERVFTTPTRVRFSGRIYSIQSSLIHIQLMINEEGNWGDLLPDRGAISLQNQKITQK